MWLIADYEPVGLFSLRHSTATTSGAKSLLVPTPYALKMALLDAACRVWGASKGEDLWPVLRDLPVAVALPQRAVVTNLFAKILKPRRNPAKPGAQHAGYLGKTIAYREYVWSQGPMRIALGFDRTENKPLLSDLLIQVNYLGKRGGFVQLLRHPVAANTLPDGFVHLNPGAEQKEFDSRGVMQMLDDCGPEMTFDHANIYNKRAIRLGKERVLHHVVLPFQLARSSKSYTLYERIDDLI